jgi:3-hydroxyacyl-[acyl-carrier-protein] dehydratase
MPPEAHFDVSTLDTSKVVAGPDEIRKVNRQRFEMEHLDGILHVDPAGAFVVGFKNVRADEFWVRGHIPGMPLLPGVIMLEAAAQLCSYYAMTHNVIESGTMLGFAGIEEFRFRGPARPGDRLVIIAKGDRLKRRQSIFDVQGFVGGNMIFHGKIIGMPLETPAES